MVVIPTERAFCATEESAVRPWEGHGFSRAVKRNRLQAALAAEANKSEQSNRRTVEGDTARRVLFTFVAEVVGEGGTMPIPKFTFFAVEKGNMTLAEFDNGINMLIDSHLASCRPSPLAYLQDRVEKLDIVVVTHPHQDHLTGLSDVCEHFKPKHLWHCGRYFRPEPVFDDWSYYERLRSGKFSYCSPAAVRAGMTVLIGSSEIRVVAPVLPYLEGTPEDVNNNGILLSVVSGNSKVIITGDSQEEQWDTIDLSKLANASVFLASHHGRESGFSERVLKAVKPQMIVISDGEVCDTDATRNYEKFGPVSTTREHNIVVSATSNQIVAV